MAGKLLWGGDTPWKNSVGFFTFLRGGLRRVWSKHPVKLELIKRDRKQIQNPSPKGKKLIWGFECQVCRRDFLMKDCQVDHITPAGTLTKIEDIQKFVENLLCVTYDDLRLVCKLCNSTLAHAERSGMSLEDAAIDKEAIAICKQKADVVKSWITERGETPARTVPERKLQVKLLLKEVYNVDKV